MANGAKREHQLTFCVRYSDFCRCERCDAYREVMADIMPDSQKTLINSQKRTLVKEATMIDEKKNRGKGKVIPLRELYADSGERY